MVLRVPFYCADHIDDDDCECDACEYDRAEARAEDYDGDAFAPYGWSYAYGDPLG